MNGKVDLPSTDDGDDGGASVSVSLCKSHCVEALRRGEWGAMSVRGGRWCMNERELMSANQGTVNKRERAKQVVGSRPLYNCMCA